jgi:putative FmdB family regulatory protein
VPLYEYQCAKDGRFELIRKFSDPPLKKCPTCGGPIEKLAAAPAIQFKGSGWYVTDYAKKSEGKSGGASKSDSKNGDAKTSGAKSTESSASKDAAASTTSASSSTDSSTAKGGSPS